MSLATTSNDTASSATSKALEGIVGNLNEIAGKSPKLRALFAPSEKVITELHHFATSKEPDKKSKSAIADGFHEFGIQVADGLRNLYQSSKSGFKGVVQRTEKFTQKLKTMLSPKKVAIADSASFKSIDSLVKYSKRHEDQIEAMTSTDIPFISFKSKGGPGRPNNVVSVREPLKLFEYVDLAYKRNVVIGRDPDYKIKAWLQLAYCVQKHCETEGKFVATRQEVTKALNLKPRSLSAEAGKWNEAISRTKQESAINEYHSSLSAAAIKKRDDVLTAHNTASKRKDIDTVKDPNKLMRYLILTKQMQAIKLLIDNQPEAAQNANYKSLDIVMQWYIQLGSKKPIIPLLSYAKQECDITDENDLANIKRIKSMWNRGKLSE